MRTKFFHEDDYLQAQLVPLENLGFCLRQAGKIREHAQEHRIEGTNLYDDILILDEPPIPLEKLGLPLQTFLDWLDQRLSRYDQVTTGYSTLREPCPDIYAYENEEDVIFLQDNGQGVAKEIWFDYDMPLVRDFPFAEKLLFVDWNSLFICPLTKVDALEEYFRDE